MSSEIVARVGRAVRVRETGPHGVVEAEHVPEGSESADALAARLASAFTLPNWAPDEAREGRLMWRGATEAGDKLDPFERLDLLRGLALLHRAGLAHGALTTSAVRRRRGRVLFVGLAGVRPLDPASEQRDLDALPELLDALSRHAGHRRQERVLIRAVQTRSLALALAVRQLEEHVIDGPTRSTTGSTADGGAVHAERLDAARVGRYALVGLLGRGGMGIVYRAYDPDLQREVAVKCLSRSKQPETRERFLAEARSVARLDHPSLVRVLDVGVHGDQPYFVMELVSGGSLARRLEDGPLGPDEALQIAASVARALAHAHDAGIVHRDVKPSNILIDRQGRAKLSDFGVARDTTNAHRTGTGQVVGTLRYMAPEQAAGHEVGPAADIYALGLVLAECLTRSPPVPGASSRWRENASDSGASRRRRLARLDPVVAKALASKAEHRYASMTEFAEALDQANRDRHPFRTALPWVLTAVGVGALVALLGGAGLILEADRRAQEQAQTGLEDLLAHIDRLAAEGSRADAEAAFGAWEQSQGSKRVRSDGWRALSERRRRWGDPNGSLAAAAGAWSTAATLAERREAITELGGELRRRGAWGALALLAQEVPNEELDPELGRDASLSLRRDPGDDDPATRAVMGLLTETTPTPWRNEARLTSAVVGPRRLWLVQDATLHQISGTTLRAQQQLPLGRDREPTVVPVQHVGDRPDGSPIFANSGTPHLLAWSEGRAVPLGEKPPQPLRSIAVARGRHPRRTYASTWGYGRDVLALEGEPVPHLVSADPAIRALRAFATLLSIDLDGDGIDEIVAGFHGPTQELRVLDGESLELLSRLPYTGAEAIAAWRTGERPMIAWKSSSEQEVHFAEWRDGRLQQHSVVPVGNSCMNLHAADVDGDGRTDLVVTCNEHSELLWHAPSGLAVRRPLAGLPVVAVADLDADGADELIAKGDTGTLVVLGAGATPLPEVPLQILPEPPEGLPHALRPRWSRAQVLFALDLPDRASLDFARLTAGAAPPLASSLVIAEAEHWSRAGSTSRSAELLQDLLDVRPDEERARRALVRLLEQGGWAGRAREVAEQGLERGVRHQKAWWRERVAALPKPERLEVVSGGELPEGWEVVHPTAVRTTERGLVVRGGRRGVALRRLVRWDGRALSLRGVARTDWLDWASQVELRLTPVDHTGESLGVSLSARKGHHTTDRVALTCRTPIGRTHPWQLNTPRSHPADEIEIGFRFDMLDDRATCSAQLDGEPWRGSLPKPRHLVRHEPGVYALELRLGEQSWNGRTGSGHAPYASVVLRDLVVEGVRAVPLVAESRRARALRRLASGDPRLAIDVFDGSDDGFGRLVRAVALHDVGRVDEAVAALEGAVHAGADEGLLGDLLRTRPGVFERGLTDRAPELLHEAWGGTLLGHPLDPAADAVVLEALPDLVAFDPLPERRIEVVRLLCHRARALRRRGRVEEAFAHLERAAELLAGPGSGRDLPTSADPWVQLAVHQVLEDRPVEAMHAVRQAVDKARAPHLRADDLAAMPELEPLRWRSAWREVVESKRLGL
ncbi:MAG: serine/threonine protein kinase [Deltaproteobacteria bacterium]|nr:MAG: serine/threonine protein kinase [Deltaproteobacteria bacterium]